MKVSSGLKIGDWPHSVVALELLCDLSVDSEEVVKKYCSYDVMLKSM